MAIRKNNAREIKKNRKRKSLTKVLLIFGAIFLFVLIIAFSASALVIFRYAKDLPEVDEIFNYEPEATSIIYSSRGEVLAELHAEEHRIPIKLKDIPKYLQHAVIAIEDKRFYHHYGLDLKRTIGAIWITIKARGKEVQGGSTITQQLAKNILLSPERIMSRKIKDILLAIQLERKLTKDEILELYLNEIFFGHGANGVEVASQLYFGKHVSDLNLAESALLAGIIRSPHNYSPFVDPEAARGRQIVVLKKMVEERYITEEERENAFNTPLEYAVREEENPQQYRAPYFTSYVLSLILDRYGSKKVYGGGLEVYTTVDLELQALAQNVIKEDQGALIAMEVKTGFIRALVGGRDYDESVFSRAIQAERQPGSSFKPIIYAAAIDSGFATAAYSVEDKPVTFRDAYSKKWSPQNYSGTFRYKPTTIRKGLELSLNTVAAEVLNDMGVDVAIDYARRLGFKSRLSPYLSLSLGTSEVTLLEMTSAYAVFANQGIRVEPIAISRVIDRYGNVLEDNKAPENRYYEAISAETAYIMTDMLEGYIERGYGKKARIEGRLLAGKTGTTDDYADAWFIGYSPELVTGIWIGNDDRTPLTEKYRSGIAADIAIPVWVEFMKEALKKYPQNEFPKSDSIVEVTICADTGKLATELCPDKVKQAFVRGTEPRKSCDLHRLKEIEVSICQDTGLLAGEYCPNIIQQSFKPDEVPTETCYLHTKPIEIASEEEEGSSEIRIITTKLNLKRNEQESEIIIDSSAIPPGEKLETAKPRPRLESEKPPTKKRPISSAKEDETPLPIVLKGDINERPRSENDTKDSAKIESNKLKVITSSMEDKEIAKSSPTETIEKKKPSVKKSANSQRVKVSICKASGKLATIYCPAEEIERVEMDIDDVPKEFCDIHRKPEESDE